MYSFTKYLPEKSNKVLVHCDCTRTFIPEEMYCCLTCSQAFCRFCTTTEIYCYYCRMCGEIIFPQDMLAIKTQCTSCYECPVCRNSLQMMQDAAANHFFYCQYCFWSSKQIGIVDSKVDQLYGKISLEQRRTMEPMNHEFVRHLTRLKETEVEIKNKKNITKAKKMFNRTYPQSAPKQRDPRRFTFADQSRYESEQTVRVRDMRHSLDSKSLQQFNLLENGTGQRIHVFHRQQQSEQDILEFQNTNFMKVMSIDQRIRQAQIQPTMMQLLPGPLLLLTKKNRKCRKCNSFIVKIDRVKDNKFIQNVTQFLSDNTPHLTLTMAKNTTELTVLLTFSNRTKQNLQVRLLPLSSKFVADQLLWDIRQFPDQLIDLPALDIDVTQEKLQQLTLKNTLEFELVPPKTLPKVTQFGFLVEVVISFETAQDRKTSVSNEVVQEPKTLTYPHIFQINK